MELEQIELELNKDYPLKVILKASIEEYKSEKMGVVSVAFVTLDKHKAKERILYLNSQNPDDFYMIYSVPFDTDLTKLAHYPSIAISKADLCKL